MRLYHTGFQEIKKPDIRFGRKNADFGQGFYLTSDPEFARRWAKDWNGETTVLNTYELEIDNLTVCRFTRDETWLSYIFDNRSRRPDSVSADVIIGPIANDTIYDTLGITTSGVFRKEDSLRLLLIGPEYEQIVIKTEAARAYLKWISSEILPAEEIAHYHKIRAKEEESYLELLVQEIEKIPGAKTES